MSRAVVALLVAFALLSTARANIPALPYHAGAAKKAELAAPAESRKKIIDEIQADYERVLDHLSKADPGAEARAKQKRILDNIDKLLQQQDPDKSANKTPPASNGPRKPMGSGEPEPKPATPNPNDPTQRTAAETKQPQPAEPAGAKKEKKPIDLVGDTGRRAGPAPTLDELMKEHKEMRHWDNRSPHQRRQMEAFAHEQFMHRYQELLREYYRNIAESSRRKEVD